MPRVRVSHAVVVLVVAFAAVQTVVAQPSLRRLFVAVTDARGVPVLDLHQHEFDVIENGVSVPVERSRLSRDPMRILLLVDSSEAAAGGMVDIRAGLQAFINAVPEEHEIGLMTLGRQMRVRAQPDMDRTRLRQMVGEFAPDGGRTTLLDALRETDERFMRRLEDGRWPVYVIVTTDGPEGSGSISADRYVQLVQGMLVRGVIAHAVVVQLDQAVRAELNQMRSMAQQVTPRAGAPRVANSPIPERTPDPGEIALNLTRNLRGSYEALVGSAALVDRLRALGQRIVDDHRLMRTRYEIEYRGSRDLAVGAAVRVAREGLQVAFSPRRPI
jgi:hypothetical protein